MRFPLDKRKIVGYAFGVPTFYNDFHLGVDYEAPNGTNLYAPEDGQIINRLTGQAGGLTLWLKGKSGYTYRFLHLRDFQVINGALVKEGQLIAHCDNTGTSTSDHLHLDITKPGLTIDPSKKNNFVDPEKYIWDTVGMTCEQELVIAREEIRKLNFELGVVTPQRDKALADLAQERSDHAESIKEKIKNALERDIALEKIKKARIALE